jgi:predicted solute-binding protein
VTIKPRIGGISYLNVRPLVYGIENQVGYCEPSRLADLMYRKQFDVGIVPIAEVLLHDQYDVLDGIAIAARGAVRSVFLTHRVPLEKMQRVAVTPASRTSVWLLRVLLKVGYHIEPEFYPRPPGAKLSEHEAMMLIGDEAIWYATRNGEQPLWDLGAAWVEMTGLPFVFAAWAFQRDAEKTELAAVLRDAKANGLAHIEEIVQQATEATPEFLRDYYSNCVWYNLGDTEKQGIRRFQQYLREVGLVSSSHDLRYVA